MSVTLLKFLYSVQGFYKSYYLRRFVVNKQCISATLTLSHNEVDMAKPRILKTRGAGYYEEVQSPFTNIDKFRQDFETIALNDEEKINSDNIIGETVAPRSTPDENEFRILFVHYLPSLVHTNELNTAVVAFGRTDIGNIQRELLHGVQGSSSRTVEVIAPLGITNPSWSYNDDLLSVDIDVRFPGNYLIGIRQINQSEHPAKNKLLFHESFEVSNHIHVEVPRVILSDLDDTIRVQLVHEGLEHEVAYQYKSLREIVISAGIVTNPLPKLLDYFMSPKDLEKNALQSHATGKENVDSFENVVHIILTLGGIPNIWLGKYENLKNPKTGVIYGTVDILAYDSETTTVLVISCKRSSPESKSIDSISSTAKNLAEQFGDSKIQFIPIIVLGAPSPSFAREAARAGVRTVQPETLALWIKSTRTGNLSLESIPSLESHHRSDTNTRYI